MAGITMASPSPLSSGLDPRAACGEGSQQICYGQDGGTAQKLNIDDVKYAAAYLRYIGNENEGEPEALFTFPKAVDCAEWTIEVPGAGTVLVLAKHISARVKSSVLYTDIANTIDGGEGASDSEIADSLLSCKTQGGQQGVLVNEDDAAYQSDDYKDSGATTDGVIIKLVRAPDSK